MVYCDTCGGLLNNDGTCPVCDEPMGFTKKKAAAKKETKKAPAKKKAKK